MAKSYGLLSLFSTIMIILIPANMSYPLAKNDLVFGEDFLSIYISQEKSQSKSKNDNNNNSKYLYSAMEQQQQHPIEMNRNENPIQPSSIMEDRRYTDNKYEPDIMKETVNMASSTSFSNLITEEVTEMIMKKDKMNREPRLPKPENVVKFVTTGSKIVFLEDIADIMKSNDEIPSTTPKSMESSKSSEIKVVSVSVSSSKTKTYPEDYEHNTRRRYPERDSLKQESLRIQTIVSPPDSLQIQPQVPSVEMNPHQSVIVHDTNYPREGNAKPRAVSYSSITQTINRSMKDKPTDIHHTSQQNMNSSRVQMNVPKIFSEPAKIYSEPAKMYGEPAKFYSEPAKIYSEPAKIYSEPAKFYSEPAKIYSEPAKIYGVPAKFYSRPAGYMENTPLSSTTTTTAATTTTTTSTTPSPSPDMRKVIFNLDRLPYDYLNAPTEESFRLDEYKFQTRGPYPLPVHHHTSHVYNASLPTAKKTQLHPLPHHESNFQIPESDRIAESGRSSENDNSELDPKVGYVVESRDYRKYRVEEKTSDGFIVGEYGVVSNNDGSLRGVRYTADSNINPNLIHKALMKFLSL